MADDKKRRRKKRKSQKEIDFEMKETKKENKHRRSMEQSNAKRKHEKDMYDSKTERIRVKRGDKAASRIEATGGAVSKTITSVTPSIVSDKTSDTLISTRKQDNSGIYELLLTNGIKSPGTNSDAESTTTKAPTPLG